MENPQWELVFRGHGELATTEAQWLLSKTSKCVRGFLQRSRQLAPVRCLSQLVEPVTAGLFVLYTATTQKTQRQWPQNFFLFWVITWSAQSVICFFLWLKYL